MIPSWLQSWTAELIGGGSPTKIFAVFFETNVSAEFVLVVQLRILRQIYILWRRPFASFFLLSDDQIVIFDEPLSPVLREPIPRRQSFLLGQHSLVRLVFNQSSHLLVLLFLFLVLIFLMVVLMRFLQRSD